MRFFFQDKSSAISYKVTLSLSSAVLKPRPIDCKFRILLLLGDANTILCSLFILIPVESSGKAMSKIFEINLWIKAFPTIELNVIN